MGIPAKWNLTIGHLPHGPLNKISDVPGVTVGHCTLADGDVQTGVTALLPHPGDLFHEKLLAASHVINGFGKTTGLVQIDELGTLETPILFTNTLSVGTVETALVIGSVLIDVIVQPVLIQQVGMGTPAEEGRLLRVVVGIVILGHCNGQALAHIPLVLGIQRVLIVLRVAGDKDLAAIFGAHEERACLVALGQDAEGAAVEHIFPADAGMAAVGGVEHLIKAADQRVCRAGDLVLKHAEHLFRPPGVR